MALFYSDAENWQYVSEYEQAVGHVPLIYAAYRPINPLAAVLDTTDLQDLVAGHGRPYHLNLGIYYTDPNGAIDVAAILSGQWDAVIADLADEVAGLGVPCFVRPGFEFGAADGVHGALSGPEFVAIWHHLRAVFAARGATNVAWVWNAVNPASFDYTAYYPGDEAVDWWGINYFTVSQMTASEQFVVDAAAHGKPVMVCESCPITGGGTTNPDNWQAWFVPYFQTIARHPHIKAFTYISDPWDRPGFWESWPDTRIDANELIRANYAAELAAPRYVHLDPDRPGDIDGDGDVDLADLAGLLSCYGACLSDGRYDPVCDLDHDGCVELADLAALLAGYGG